MLYIIYISIIVFLPATDQGAGCIETQVVPCRWCASILLRYSFSKSDCINYKQRHDAHIIRINNNMDATGCHRNVRGDLRSPRDQIQQIFTTNCAHGFVSCGFIIVIIGQGRFVISYPYHPLRCQICYIIPISSTALSLDHHNVADLLYHTHIIHCAVTGPP